MKMWDISKTNELNLLYDLYSKLLTPKQQKYFSLYLMENFSLQEIANELNVSRSAVHDAISKIINILNTYEEKMQLLAKDIRRKTLYAYYENETEANVEMLIAELRKID
ncbi:MULTISPECIES: YlxM family DNA-binding protein [unclassified Spiroplasma]|uniref:YlxM family DNA-binding protein n=1 Tax=unclassified Spiroplasma TaxID=2637901 RepID=UPI0030D610E2